MVPTFRRILVPIDFSPSSSVALSCALSLAGSYAGGVHLIHAWSEFIPPQPDAMFWASNQRFTHDQMREEAEKWMREFVASQGLLERKDVSSEVLEGVPEVVILLTAEARDTDLIVMGTHGRKGIPRLLIGSVAEKVVRQAKCPVLTVHAPPVEAQAEPQVHP